MFSKIHNSLADRYEKMALNTDSAELSAAYKSAAVRHRNIANSTSQNLDKSDSPKSEYDRNLAAWLNS